MRIQVTNQQARADIDTGDASMQEVIDMIFGALCQEGFAFGTILEGFKRKVNELENFPKE